MKEFLRATSKYLKNWYSQQNEKYLALKRQEQVLIYDSYSKHAQLLLQNALTEVFKQTTISSKLAPIRTTTDLIPVGYEIINEYATVYKFAWIKSCEDVISTTILSQFTLRMNQAIRNIMSRYSYMYMQLSDFQKLEYIENNPAMYNGFHIIDCKDDCDAIILSVAFD